MSKITRRNFINGTLMASGASMLPFRATGQAVLDKLDPLYYPPALTGLRGSHMGSSTHAHARALTKKSDWGPTANLNESYDLVVVGGGISGLSAAYFYQQKHGKDRKVLILDNHDDFGGHAKRNEFWHGDKMLLSHGGTINIQDFNRYGVDAQRLIHSLGIDPSRYAEFHDKDLHASLGLQNAVFFGRETFGTDRLVAGPG